MQLSGAQMVVKALEDEQVELIFGYPGAANAPLYDVLSKSSIRHILTRSEQGAAHAANGYARASGRVGVCMATSGPGATNLITGIATAYMDSVPMVAITGQVTRQQIGKDVFQEVDITGACEPFTKHSYLVSETKDLPRIVKEAFHIAGTGRPGPVLIDIPLDVMEEQAEYVPCEKVEIRGYNPTIKGNYMQVKRAADALKKSEKPVIIAGGGVLSSGACEDLATFSKQCNIPCVTTLMGISALEKDNAYCFGMLGSHGVAAANRAVNMADLWLVVGARLADRAIANAKKRKITIIHIDIDPAEIGKNFKTTYPIVGDLKTVLSQLTEQLGEAAVDASGFLTQVRSLVSKKEQNLQEGFVNPKYAMELLSSIAPENAYITTEVGQNQIWAANNYHFKQPGHFLTSGGLGTMGYGLPSAVGAKAAKPENEVIAVCGDGSFQMSFQELATMCQWGIGVKIVLFRNGRLGMVRELQRQKFQSNYFSVFLDGSPNFIQLASAYGIPGQTVTENENLKEAFEKLLLNKGPYLLELVVDPEESTL